MVSNDQIVAIAAENFSIDAVWFVYVIDKKFVDHSSNNINNYGHNVPKSQLYLLCNCLEKLNYNKKVAVYQKTKKCVFIYKVSLVYALIEFEPNYSKKEDLFFLSNNRFIEVLNCVQFQQWVHYFSHNCFS